jgi:hypothetical protein
VGQYRDRRIHQIDRGIGAIHRFVTGITWVEGDLWHRTSEATASELRRVDHPRRGQYVVMAPDGAVLTRCTTLHDADTGVAQFAFLATRLTRRRRVQPV